MGEDSLGGVCPKAEGRTAPMRRLKGRAKEGKFID
jgi:hypothetical protein